MLELPGGPAVTTEALFWYASIYCWMLFTGIGIPPCPEEAGILYSASVTALHPDVHWWLAWPVTSLGIVSADLVLYGIGRLWGQKLFQLRWVRWVLKPERRQRIEERFHTHGIKILIAARFLPPLRTGVFLIAGSLRFSFVRFLLADGIFATIGVGFFFFCGTWIIQYLGRFKHRLAYAAAALIGGYALYRYYRYLRRRELRGEPTPPQSVLEVPPPPRADGQAKTEPSRDPEVSRRET